MVEKLLVCPKCMWVSKTKEEQLTICPKCGTECVKRDFLTDEKDMKAWRDDLIRDSGKRRFRRPPDEDLQ